MGGSGDRILVDPKAGGEEAQAVVRRLSPHLFPVCGGACGLHQHQAVAQVALQHWRELQGARQGGVGRQQGHRIAQGGDPERLGRRGHVLGQHDLQRCGQWGRQ